MRSIHWTALLFFTATCFAAGAVGSVLTFKGVKTWYPHLRKPRFTPPNSIFGPVWSTLYLLMAVSAWWVWRQARWSRGRSALILFFVQLVLNVLWPALFFRLRRPGLALVEIILLLASILATAFAFARISEIALYLLLPYIAWVSFATALNLRIWQLNRDGVLDAIPNQLHPLSPS